MENFNDFITDNLLYDAQNSWLTALIDSIPTLQENLMEGAEDLDTEGDIRYVVNHMASIAAIRFLVDNYISVIRSVFLEAMYESKEYNYEPYVLNMYRALAWNEDKLVTVKRTGNDAYPEIIVDLSVLGSIDIWEEVCQSTREKLGMGNLRKRDIMVASEKWRRLIYSVDREGATVIRKKKSKGDDGEEKIEEEDVTEQYRGLYQLTIQTRLSLLAPGQAPYWYLLEHGNKNVSGLGLGGIEYPTVLPQHMQNNIELSLQQGYSNTYYRYMEIAEEIIKDAIEKLKEEPGEEPPPEKTIQEIVEGLIKKVPSYDPKYGTKTLTMVRDTEGYFYEIFYQLNGIVDVRMADAAHHYMGKPWWWGRE